MQIVNGKEGEVIGMLGAYGLCKYETKMYFTLLTLGEGKVVEITRKASVPQSKAYKVLKSLMGKGFVELSETEKPMVYRVRTLEEATDLTIRARHREIRELEKHSDRLGRILQAVAPLHQKYKDVRLFTPKHKTRKKTEMAYGNTNRLHMRMFCLHPP